MEEVKYQLAYEEHVVRDDIPKLTKADTQRIRRAIEEKLAAQPDLFGKPLRRSLSGYRCLRVGDHRIIYRIDGDTIRIFAIAHRSIVYEDAPKRIRRK